MTSKKSDVETRKENHIKICLDKNVEPDISSGFGDVVLVHHALVDIDKDEIDLSCDFLGKKLEAPIVIEAMTGGAKIAEKINRNLAKAANEVGVAFGVGSVRAALVDEKLWKTYKVRDVAPKIPVISNIGIVQLIDEYDMREIKDSIKEIGADALAIHLNPLQEVVQPEGNVKWTGSVERLKYFCQNLGVPVIVKETGAGISREAAMMIERSGALMIDIAGLGGTSFSMVEYSRDKNVPDFAFKNWGITTVCSVVECSSTVKIPIIASGGIRSGTDAVKAIAVGANYAGFALPLLKAATISHQEVVKVLMKIIDEMKTAMFLVGAKNISELKKKDAIIMGRTGEWLRARGIRLDNISNRESIDILREKVKY